MIFLYLYFIKDIYFNTPCIGFKRFIFFNSNNSNTYGFYLMSDIKFNTSCSGF